MKQTKLLENSEQLKAIAENIYSRIVNDLTDRKGIGNEWEQIDEDIIEEIKNVWTHFIIEEIENSNLIK